MSDVGAVPSGTVTFLFTDVEGSTLRWKDQPTAMASALELHDHLVRSVVADHQGYVFATAGDSFAASFARAADAVRAAVDLQRRLNTATWPGERQVRVRVGLHSGEAVERDGNYFGSAVNRAARLMSSASSGQIVVSAATHDIVDDAGLQAVEFRDLGVHRLKDLTDDQRIYQVVAAGLDGDFNALTTVDIAATNLPVTTDEFFGRTDTVADSINLLASSKLVSLVGAGGIGKTRLAVHIAGSVTEHFPDGVWFCELAPVSDPDSVPSAVAEAVGVRPHPATSIADSIADFCIARRLLIVLDNCEHVVDAAADLVARIRRIAPEVAVLVTSREALRVAGERVVVVEPLRSEAPGSPAVELFLARATAAGAGSDWTEADVRLAERLCRRLDGIPLAIELAACRTRSMTLVDLDARLADAFRLVRGGRRDMPRHRTLETAIDCSYETLENAGRLLFDRLSVFAGGCDLAAVEAVCAGDGVEPDQIFDLLDDLVAKSLVVAETGGEHSRFRLYEPLRLYGEQHLAVRGELTERRRAHLDHFADWIEDWETRCWGEEVAWRVAITDDWTNLRAAVQWACDQRDEHSAARIVVAAQWALHALGRLEVGDWGAAVLGLDGIDADTLGADVAAATATAHFWRGDIDRMSLAILRAERMDPRCESGMRAHQLWIQGEYEQAASIQRRRAVSKRPVDRIVALWQLGLYSALDGPQQDLSASNRSLDLLRDDPVAAGSQLVESMASQIESALEVAGGDFAASAELSRQAIRAADFVGSRYFVHINMANLGAAAAGADDVRVSDLVVLARSLSEQRDARQETDQWLTLMGVMWVLSVLDRLELARDIFVGLSSSPWSDHPVVKTAEELLPILADVGPDAEPQRQLEALVDAALGELDQLAKALAV